MPPGEDPTRHLSYLQQCLSADKRPLALFLGAGCPMAVPAPEAEGQPLIPDIEGMTKRIFHSLDEDSEFGDPFRILLGQFKIDGRVSPTVEDMLTHVRALRVVAGAEGARGLSVEALDALDNAISDRIHELAAQSLPREGTPYHQVAAWVGAVRREHPVELFTTNYDLLIEQALEALRVPYFDGFAGNHSPFFDLRAMEEDALPPRWARLWKLHGSINWYHEPTRGVFRGSPHANESLRRVIHPSHLKYEQSRRMPYLAMLDRLRAFLKLPTATLVISGYSFRDEHLNEVLVDGLLSAPSGIAFAVQYDDLSAYKEGRRLSLECPNLNILAQDAGIVGGRELHWPIFQESPVSVAEQAGVRMRPLDPEDPDAGVKVRFTLGDFAELGAFLERVVGGAHNRTALGDG